eukprot:scaffold6583_cov82-Cyclotella_meneghiniana.AAC.1
MLTHEKPSRTQDRHKNCHGQRTDYPERERQTVRNQKKPRASQPERGWMSKLYRNKSYVSKEIGPEERPENQQQETHALHKRHSSSGCEGHKNGGEACDDECILVTISIMSCVNKFDFFNFNTGFSHGEVPDLVVEKIHTYEHVVSDYSNNGGLGGVPRIWSDMVLDLGRGGLVYNHVLGLLHDHGYSSIVLYPRNSPIQKQGEGR